LGGQPPSDPNVLFRGPKRGALGGSGGDAFDTFNVGLTWAPMSQKRDATKPTWTLSFEGQFSIGTIKKLVRFEPANHRVSEGLHKLSFRAGISHRLRWFEPYWGVWYMLPIPRSDSLFVDYGPNQSNKNPQQQAGTLFGVEVIPFERKKQGH